MDFLPEHAASYNELVEVVERNLLLADWRDENHEESMLHVRNAVWGAQMLQNLRRAAAGAPPLLPPPPSWPGGAWVSHGCLRPFCGRPGGELPRHLHARVPLRERARLSMCMLNRGSMPLADSLSTRGRHRPRAGRLEWLRLALPHKPTASRRPAPPAHVGALLARRVRQHEGAPAPRVRRRWSCCVSGAIAMRVNEQHLKETLEQLVELHPGLAPGGPRAPRGPGAAPAAQHRAGVQTLRPARSAGPPARLSGCSARRAALQACEQAGAL